MSESGPTLTMLDQTWPNWAIFWPSSTEFHQLLAHSCKFWSSFVLLGPHLAEVAPQTTKHRQLDHGQNQHPTGQSQPDLAEFGLNFGCSSSVRTTLGPSPSSPALPSAAFPGRWQVPCVSFKSFRPRPAELPQVRFGPPRRRISCTSKPARCKSDRNHSEVGRSHPDDNLGRGAVWRPSSAPTGLVRHRTGTPGDAASRASSGRPP